ncbi:MAG: ABC transporter permease [Acidimicrobiales bacterium]
MRGSLHAVATILVKDLRLRVRDRSAFVIGVVAPLTLALILSQVVGDFGEGEFEATFAVVDEDGGPAAAMLPDVAAQVPGVTVETDLDESEARAMVDDGDVEAAVVVPAGFSASVIEPNRTDPLELVVVGNVDAELSVEVARAIVDRYAAGIDAARLSVQLVAPDGSASPALFGEAAQQPPPINLEQLPADDRELDSTTYLMAGLGVLFLFFLVQFGVVGLLEERQGGTLVRLLAAPIHPLAIPAAKALTSVVLGLVGMASLVLVSSLFLGADWGDPFAAAVLVGAVVLAAVSIVALVVGVARTAEQASNAQSVIALVLGLLGGSFFPISRGEGLLTRLSALTPHYWFLRGLGDGQAGGVGDVVRPVLALLAFAVVIGAVGAVLLARGTWRRAL